MGDRSREKSPRVFSKKPEVIIMADRSREKIPRVFLQKTRGNYYGRPKPRKYTSGFFKKKPEVILGDRSLFQKNPR